MIQNLNLQSCLHPQKYFHSDLPSAKQFCVSFLERVQVLCNFHSYAGIRVSLSNFASTKIDSDHFIKNNIIKYQNVKNNRTLKTSECRKRQNVENVRMQKTSQPRKLQNIENDHFPQFHPNSTYTSTLLPFDTPMGTHPHTLKTR